MTAAVRSRVTTLRETDLGSTAPLVSGDAELRAEWRFPHAPLIAVALGGAPLATIDYSPASASVHWSLRWLDNGAEIGLATLASQVPEDAENDDRMRAAILDVALEACATRLAGRPLDLAFRDA